MIELAAELITIVTFLLIGTFYLLYFFHIRRILSFKKAIKTKNFQTLISVVIPTYNEEATIKGKLENLLKQDYPRELMEVIVIDSASTDNTIEILKNFLEKNEVSIKIITEKERRGKAEALNTVFKQFQGNILIISDADSILEENAISQLISNFEDQEVGAATGRQILLNPDQTNVTKLEKSYRNLYQNIRIGESLMDSTPIFHGELSGYRKDLLERFVAKTIADDSTLAVKIRKKGYRSIYDPEAIFYEYTPHSFKSRFQQKIMRAQGLIQMFWREKDVLFNSEYGKFGRIIFPSEFFMHIISPVLLISFLVTFIISIAYNLSYGLILIGILVFLSSILYILSFLFKDKVKINVLAFVSSFLNLQFILFIGLILLLCGKSRYNWEKVDEIRDLWKERS